MIVFFGKTFKQKDKINEGYLLKLTKRVMAAPALPCQPALTKVGVKLYPSNGSCTQAIALSTGRSVFVFQDIFVNHNMLSRSVSHKSGRLVR